jgi:hypothetical protein
MGKDSFNKNSFKAPKKPDSPKKIEKSTLTKKDSFISSIKRKGSDLKELLVTGRPSLNGFTSPSKLTPISGTRRASEIGMTDQDSTGRPSLGGFISPLKIRQESSARIATLFDKITSPRDQNKQLNKKTPSKENVNEQVTVTPKKTSKGDKTPSVVDLKDEIFVPAKEVFVDDEYLETEEGSRIDGEESPRIEDIDSPNVDIGGKTPSSSPKLVGPITESSPEIDGRLLDEYGFNIPEMFLSPRRKQYILK